MTLNGMMAVTLHYYTNALDFKSNYIKVVENRPTVSATKMWPNESSFLQYMTDANILRDYGERVC